VTTVFTVLWLGLVGLGLAMLVNRQVRAEVFDIVEFRWSRWRARRRLPGARLIVKELQAGAGAQASSTSKSPVSTA
jgi:hypothetical protein